MRIFSIVALIAIVVTDAVAQTPSRHDAAEIESAVIAVLDDYMTSFNAMDLTAWEQKMHFPQYRLAGGKMTVRNGPGGLSIEAMKRALGDEWHHSAWNRREVIHLSESKVHVDTRFTHYREDGSVISAHDSLYIVTKEAGRWGVKMRSSFFPGTVLDRER